MARIGAALVVVAMVGTAADLPGPGIWNREPIPNTPVGLNFLMLGYAYTWGDVTSRPVHADRERRAHGAQCLPRLRARVRRMGSISQARHRAAVRVGVGHRRVRRSSPAGSVHHGPRDARVRFSRLFYGAPALTLAAFRVLPPGLVVGASLPITLPIGHYDSDRLVNIGTNRWSVKPELGLSKTRGPVTLELAPSLTFYTDNDDFLGPDPRAASPLRGARTPDLPHEARPLGLLRRHLLRGRPHHGRRRAGRGAAEPSPRRDARDPHHPAALGQAVRQHGRRTRAWAATSPRSASPGSFAGVGGL